MDTKLTTFLSTLCLLVTTVTAKEWAYSGSHGPLYWRHYYPHCEGTSQSPVDIVVEDAKYSRRLVPFIFTGYEQTTDPVFIIKNNGHTVQVEVSGTGTYDLTGGNLPHAYRLAQFHFHWGSDNTKGSEHTLDGAQYPMEMHMVHYNSDDYGSLREAADQQRGLAVVGFLFEIGEHNVAFNNIIERLQNVRFSGESDVIPTFSLMSLLPNTDRYFRYSGSLTTPGCFESVVWSIIENPIMISQTQMNAFRRLFVTMRGAENNKRLVNNFRSLQHLGHRMVYVS